MKKAYLTLDPPREPDGTLLEISVYAQDPLALLEFLLDG